MAYGVELLRIDPIAMMERLREQGIAVADYSPQTLHEEVEDSLHDFETQIDSTD